MKTKTLKDIKVKSHIIILDVDGTLTPDSQNQLNPETRKEIDRLSEENEIYLLSNKKIHYRNRKIAKSLNIPYLQTDLSKPNPQVLKKVENPDKWPFLIIGDLAWSDGRLADNINAKFEKVTRFRAETDHWYIKLAYFIDDHFVSPLLKYRQFLKLIRVNQWYKNLIVFTPLLFSTNPRSLSHLLLAFLGFCAISSASYIINDYLDRKKDKLHPTKSLRPLASGRITPSQSTITALILIFFAIGISLALGPFYGGIIIIYFLLTNLYSLGFKNIPILDISLIASNFVLRTLAGINETPWESLPSYLLIFATIALFAIHKRRSDQKILKEKSVEHKPVLKYYTPLLSNSIRIICYILMALSLWVMYKDGSSLILIIPLVIFLIITSIILSINPFFSSSPGKLFRSKIWITSLLLLLVIGVINTLFSLSTHPYIKSAELGGNYLIDKINNNGEFLYLYDAKYDTDKGGYNILRHAGTSYSLLELYEVTGKKKYLYAAEKALKYLNNQIFYCGNFSRCLAENNEVKLGGNGLAILAFAKHIEVTRKEDYLETAQSLARWIVNNQAENGEFWIHKYKIKEKKATNFKSDYYPGEAIFGLLELYKIDQNPTWLLSAYSATDWLIKTRDKGKKISELPKDHWFLYALNELYQLKPNEEHYEHAIKLAKKINQDQSKYFPLKEGEKGPSTAANATAIEGLLAAYSLTHRPDFLQGIELSIPHALNTQITATLLDQTANPARALGGFRVNLHEWYVRNDYVQHNISALLGAAEILD
ncbi:UbiA family prenyltransferase [Patescibacteria group bacterium]|nr:UbiA family prenyltransferase [Patescibacteria group bacterium]